MKINWRREIIPLFFIVVTFVLAAIAWPQAPDRIPVHWGFSGEPDSYAGKGGLLYLPFTALGIYLLLIFLPRIDPRRKNYEKFQDTYLVIRAALVVVMACVQIFTVLWALDVKVNLNIAVPVIVGLLFVLIGNFSAKFRPNWFVGIRTPWTLSSDESWNKTHRLGGWLFVVFGLALTAAAPFQQAWAFITLGVFLGVMLVGLFVYSYLIWKNDPAARKIGERSNGN